MTSAPCPCALALFSACSESSRKDWSEAIKSCSATRTDLSGAGASTVMASAPSLPVLPLLTKRQAVRTMGDVLVEIQTKQAADAASALGGGEGLPAGEAGGAAQAGSTASGGLSAVAGASAGVGVGAGLSTAGAEGGALGHPMGGTNEGSVGGGSVGPSSVSVSLAGHGNLLSGSGSAHSPGFASSSSNTGHLPGAPTSPHASVGTLAGGHLRGHEDAWEVLEQDVQVIAKIGGGSFGDIYRGRLWGSDVAVKLLLAAVVTEEVRDWVWVRREWSCGAECPALGQGFVCSQRLVR